jgi:predicted nucleic acid-binding protein
VTGELLTVDTNVLWWYLSEEKPLPLRARQALRETEHGEHYVLVPTLALAEILNLIRKPRYIQRDITLQERFAEVLLRLDNRAESFEIVPLTREIIERAASLALELETLFRAMGTPKIKDVRDLVFMATADLDGCTLITSDRDIRRSGLVPCLW